MVSIFFVVSGYALSLKSLKQIRSNENAALLGTISSALFRRALRLFLPVFVSTFLGAILLQMNFRQGGAPTLSAQLWAWYSELKQVLDFWNPDCRPWITDDPHLWTISLEMGNSVLLFAVLIAVARCKAMLRMGILGGMILVCMRAGQWVGSAFLMGMFLAELGLIQDSLKHSFDHPEIIALGIPGEESESLLGEGGVELREEVAERAQRRHQIRHRRLREARRVGNIAMKCICIFNLIPALWLAGWPEMYPEQNAGFAWIMARTGPPYDDIFRQQFPWFGLVALTIVFSCQQVPFL